MATSDNTNMTDTSRPEERFSPATYSPGMLAGDFIGRTAPSLHHWMMPDCWSPQASGGFRNSSEFFSQSPLPQSTVQTNSTPVQRPVIGTQELHGGHCQFGYQQQIPNFASPVQHLKVVMLQRHLAVYSVYRIPHSVIWECRHHHINKLVQNR